MKITQLLTLPLAIILLLSTVLLLSSLIATHKDRAYTAQLEESCKIKAIDVYVTQWNNFCVNTQQEALCKPPIDVQKYLLDQKKAIEDTCLH